MVIANRIAEARLDAGFTAVQLAKELGVDKATLSCWETGRRPVSLEKLLQIAGVLNVSVSNLLNLDEQIPHDTPVTKTALSTLHRMPVWTERFGWALVNATKQQLIFADGSVRPFEAMQEALYITPPAFAVSLRGIGAPLDIDEVMLSDRVWVEPITLDTDLASELRGWYRLRERRLVENEFGNRFYLDYYGAKWLAFRSCIARKEND